MVQLILTIYCRFASGVATQFVHGLAAARGVETSPVRRSRCPSRLLVARTATNGYNRPVLKKIIMCPTGPVIVVGGFSISHDGDGGTEQGTGVVPPKAEPFAAPV